MIKINAKIDNIISKCVLAILFLWPLFFITRGIDYMDSGYYLSQYKYYLYGEAHKYAATELTYLFGSLLYNIMPGAKFLSFRVLEWLASSMSCYLSYKIASKSLPKVLAALGVLIGSVFLRRYPMMLSYNSFSILLLVVAMYFLQKGVLDKNNKAIIASGFIIGFNVFFRLPNVLQCLYVFIPLLAVLSHDKSEMKMGIKPAFYQCLYFTLSGLLGLFLGFIITAIHLGLHGTIESMGLTLSLLQEGDHTTEYALNRINKEYILYKQYIFNLSMYPYYMLIVGVFLGGARTFIKNRYLRYAAFAVSFVAIAKIVYITVDNLNYGNNFSIFMPYFTALYISVISLVFIRKNKSAFITSLMFLLVMLIFPIGTDNGIVHSCLFMYIVLLNMLVCLNAYTIKHTNVNKFLQSVFLVFTIVVLLTVGVGGTKNILLKVSYNDGQRDKQTVSVDVPVLRGMKTINQRAIALQSVYEELNSRIEFADRELLMFGDFSLVYIMTDHKPFMGETWADLKHIDKSAIFKKFIEIEKKPIVLIENINGTRKMFHKKHYDIADELCKQFNYTKLEKEYYTIYYPLS